MPVEDRTTPGTLLVEDARVRELRGAALSLPSLTLTRRQLCDLELLLNGGFQPLEGFLNEAAYQSVVETGRLPDGSLWPIPVVLDVGEAFAEKLTVGQPLALRDAEGFMPAVLTVETLWRPDKGLEAERVYGTRSPDHPGVRYLYEATGPVYVGGRIEGLQYPTHAEFEDLWQTPEELRHRFKKMGWRRVLGVHASNPLHRVHRELILGAAKAEGTHILLHPAVGTTKPGDLHHFARIKCYRALCHRFPHEMAMLSLLPISMRIAGPRETLWRALINRNFGCSHFLVGPDQASPPPDASGNRFYGKYDALDYVQGFAAELGTTLVAVREHSYVPRKRAFLSDQEVATSGQEAVQIGNNQLKELLSRDEEIPEWFSYPEVLEQLRQVYPPRSRVGITLFFTGLSGSGKSTLANILYAKLIEAGGRPVSLLDGDIVRQNLSSELGFSKAHRDLNIRRIGFVATEITKNGGVAICAPIAPYRETRRAVRAAIEEHGAFIEIHVATPLEVCEGRDRKGLYAKARQGLIPEFTGISDPYEVPERPELRIDTSELEPAEAAQEILLYLFKEGYLDNEG